MSNIFLPSIVHSPQVGTPTIVQGTLLINLPSIVHSPEVFTPSIGHISLKGNGIPSSAACGVPTLYATSRVNEVHPQIDVQVPDFIRDEHPEFLGFMRAYYRYTEKKDGPLFLMRRLLSVQNIDTTTNDLIEYFFREYAPSFPRTTALTPATIIKNIRQFYLAKGSEKSFRFLFKVFFGDDVDFYYPRLDILRFSDGKWIQDRTIKCVLLSGDPAKLIGNRIIGQTTRTTAFVEKVLLVQDGSITTYELFLNRSSILGKFDPNEIIKDEAGTSLFRVLPIISKIQVTNPGQGYEAGQEVVIAGDGFNCKARVNEVDDQGKIRSVQIYQFGSGYTEGTTTVTFPPYPGVIVQAFGKAVFDTITKYPGYFLNSDGMPSSLKAIQDSYYYQQFSYVIRSSVSRDRYESLIKNLAHPAGFLFFSEVFTESQIDAEAGIPESPEGDQAMEIERFDELQFDWNQFNITEPQELFYVDAGAEIEESSVELVQEDTGYAEDNYGLGPTWRDFEVWKKDYRPTPVFGQPTGEMSDPAYYNANINTPLKFIADVKLSEIIFSPWTQIDHLPETEISQEPD